MKKRKAKIKHHQKGQPSLTWAFQILFFSISMSIMLGLLSQTLLSRLGIIVSAFCICIFIFLSVVFDMFGIAVASANEKLFAQWRKDGVFGASAGLHLCENQDKVCSFCADVVGDICSTLCGAAGACIVLTLSNNLTNQSLIILISTLVSAVIAGLTIFFKALMKQYAIKNCNAIILKVGKLIEKWGILKKHKKR